MPLNNDNSETYVSATPSLSEAGLYRVEFIEPGGCLTLAELTVSVVDCSDGPPDPLTFDPLQTVE